MGTAGDLPFELTSLVGRRLALASVKEALSTSRLVTLTGVGGVGKTRLALHCASQLHRMFPGGVRAVELAGVRDPELLAQSVGTAIGAREVAGRSALQAVLDFIGDKRLLLVLDNCEHLIDSCAGLVDALLRQTPKLCVLTTSREALRVDGEHVVAVRPLDLPEAPLSGGLAEVMRSAAVQLFVERATAVLPEFALTADNAEVVARLCRRLDGIPLAIELAAVWLRTLTPQQIVQRLDHRFEFLRTGHRASAARQRTIEALVSWSFELCSAAERRLWRRLSVFPSTFGVAEVEEICGDQEMSGQSVVDALSGLVGKSVVSRVSGGPEPRLELLETIREYGGLRLAESGEEAEYQRRHRDLFLELAERVRREWYGSGQVAWSARLGREHANFRAALTFSFSSAAEAESGLRLASALRMWWTAAGLMTEGRQWLARGLALWPEPGGTTAAALLADAKIALLQGDHVGARESLAKAEALAGDDQDLRLTTRTASGQLALYERRYADAIGELTTALTSARARDDAPNIVENALSLALAASSVGDGERAIELGEWLERYCADRGETMGRSYALWTIGVERWRRGDVEPADARLRESLQLGSALGDRLNIALCFEGLAWIAAEQGRIERAARLLGANEPLSRSIGLSLGQYRHLLVHVRQCRKVIREADQGLVGAAHEAGRALSLDDAVAFALEESAAVPERTRSLQAVSAAAEPAPMDSLTPREREVAKLVAAGLSNKEIAAKLVIAQRTAEGHVQRILVKLGFTSRAKVASWFTESHYASADSSRTL